MKIILKKYLIITILLNLIISNWGPSVNAQNKNTAEQGYTQKKVIKGKLDRNGNAVIKQQEIKIKSINLENPNFFITAYVRIKDYWVTSRVFINKDSISLETSASFKSYPYIIIIIY